MILQLFQAQKTVFKSLNILIFLFSFFVCAVRGRDHFDVLPEGWIEVTHNSGMPIYLHKASRVCSVSKPYFLGPGSTRVSFFFVFFFCVFSLDPIMSEELKSHYDPKTAWTFPYPFFKRF